MSYAVFSIKNALDEVREDESPKAARDGVYRSINSILLFDTDDKRRRKNFGK